MKAWLSLLLKMELKTGLHLRQERWGLQLRIRKSFPCAAMACLISGGSLLPRGRREESGLQVPQCLGSGVSDEWSAARRLHYGASPSWQRTSGVGKAWVSDLHHLLRWQMQGEGGIWGNFGFVRLFHPLEMAGGLCRVQSLGTIGVEAMDRQ